MTVRQVLQGHGRNHMLDPPQREWHGAVWASRLSVFKSRLVSIESCPSRSGMIS